MDSTQISKAQDMARDCLIKKYKNCDFSSAVYSEEPKVDAINEERVLVSWKETNKKDVVYIEQK